MFLFPFQEIFEENQTIFQSSGMDTLPKERAEDIERVHWFVEQ